MTEPAQVTCDACSHDHFGLRMACTNLDCKCYEPVIAEPDELSDWPALVIGNTAGGHEHWGLD